MTTLQTIVIGDYVVNLSEIISGNNIWYGGQLVQVFKVYRNGQSVSNLCAYIIQTQYIFNQIVPIPLQLMANQDLSFNILQLYDYILYDNKHVHIGESCDLSLENYLQSRAQFPLSSQEIFDIFGQIVNGYTYLAKCQIKVNLNLEMIYIKKLMDNQVIIKLFDYIYQYRGSNNDNSIWENLIYMAPETLQSGTNDQRSDIFSLGIILYQLCYQQHPFKEKIQSKQTIMANYTRNLQNKPSINLPNNPNIDPELQSLIKKMLVFNADDRIKWQNLQANPKLKPKFVILKNKQNRYYINFEKKLGSGAQGITFLSIDLETQQYCGAKRISNKQQESQREIEIYKTLLSKSMMCLNIIQIKDIIRYDDQYTFIIMEKCDENLEEYFIKNKDSLNDSDIVEFLYQVTLGYIFLKNMNIIHRDLKPQNILVKYTIQQPLFKIIDLGVGKILTQQQLATSLAGTPLFSAPEVFNETGNYNHQCDIFSLGAVLYYMVYHKSHVNVQTLEQLKAFFDRLKYNKGEIKYPNENGQGKKVNQDIYFLMQEMLQHNPVNRITWENLKIKLESIKQKLPITTKIRVIAQSQGQTQMPPQSQPVQLSNQQYDYQFNQNNRVDYGQQQQIFAQNSQPMEIKQQKIKILSQVQTIPDLYYPSEATVNQHNNAQYPIAYQGQQFTEQQQPQENYNSNRNQIQIQSPQSNQLYIQNQNVSGQPFYQNGSIQVSPQQNMIQNGGQSNNQIKMNFKEIDQFTDALQKIINKEKEQIGIVDIISSLIIASCKANKLLKSECSKEDIDIKESIALYCLITIFIDVCLDNLQVLKEKKYLLLDEKELEIGNSFLDNLLPQSIILMKREIQIASNDLLMNASKRKEYTGIKEQVQNIKNYHEITSRKRNVSFLEGLTYFLEYYQECQAKAREFPPRIKAILEQLYLIHQLTDFESLKEYIFVCKLWDV